MLRVNGAGPAEHVLEVVTPRTNVARLSAAEHLFGALVPGSGHAPASLEIVGDSERRRFLVRTTSAAELRRISGQLAAAYPQAVLRPFDAATFPNGDPARVGPDEQVAAATLQLRAGEYLPLRTFEDRELDGAGSSVQVDPLLGVLGALGDLPGGWRAIAQLLVLAPAPADWASAYQRLALERPLENERGAHAGPSPAGPLAILGLVGLYLLVSSITAAWSRGDWLGALGLVSGALVFAIAGTFALRWLRRRTIVDPRLVQVKLGRDAWTTELRIGIVAPAFADPSVVHARLDRAAAAYRAFSLATGNGLVARAIRSAAADLRELAPFGPTSLLNVRELAGLWHLPQAGDDVVFVERTTARRRLPLRSTVAPNSGTPAVSASVAGAEVPGG